MKVTRVIHFNDSKISMWNIAFDILVFLLHVAFVFQIFITMRKNGNEFENFIPDT